MPNKLFRFLRMVSLVLESASKVSSEGYFNANTAKPDINESLRVNCRPRTGSSMSSKHERTARSSPGMLNCFLIRRGAMIVHP